MNTNAGQTASTSSTSSPWSHRVLAGGAIAALLVFGIFALGRLAPTEMVAMGLTTAWFALVAGLGFLVWRRRRQLLVPLALGYGVVALAAAGWLGLPEITDRVVDESVVTGVAPGEAGAGENVRVAQGTFRPLAHQTAGTATVVRLPDGSHRLTLTGFATDNGPDLRVHLAPGSSGESVEGGVDLGGLKGNRGNQEYVLPKDLDPADFEQVVIWCRAFAVSFGAATLDLS